MKLLTNLICSALILSLPSYSAETLTSESHQIGRIQSTEPHQKRLKHQEIDWSDNVITLDKVRERLEYKAVVLTAELPKAHKYLTTLESELTKKARELRDEDFRRASDLAVLASGIKVVTNSTNKILHNLKERDYSEERSLVNVSMAIMASGALKNQLDQIIISLCESPDTRGINPEILRLVSGSIHTITKDIENPNLAY